MEFIIFNFLSTCFTMGTENHCCVVWLLCGCLFVFVFIGLVRRQCWETCATVLPIGVTTVDFVFNGEPMR